MPHGNIWESDLIRISQLPVGWHKVVRDMRVDIAMQSTDDLVEHLGFSTGS
jgi:hypothetical protein